MSTLLSGDGLIMESAFTSAFLVLTKYALLPFEKFHNLAKIRHVHYPVLVIHGKRDRIISFYHGKKLFAAANEPKRSHWVDRAGHNNLAMVAGSRYLEEQRRFAELAENSRRSR